MIAAGNDNLFSKLCDVLNLGHLVHDPLYATNSDRVVNRTRLIPVIAEAVSRFTPDDLSGRLDAAGVPNAPLYAVDAVARHPQTEALDMSVTVEGLKLMGIPLAFDGVRPRALTPAPKLGQDNDRILDEMLKKAAES
jgi:crotonobetainyl-CoA:carnitine CoA-transferase CaiB-like acyl-CoA transferase